MSYVGSRTNRYSFSALFSSRSKNLLPRLCGHAALKAVLVFSFSARRLECSFHDGISLTDCFLYGLFGIGLPAYPPKRTAKICSLFLNTNCTFTIVESQYLNSCTNFYLKAQIHYHSSSKLNLNYLYHNQGKYNYSCHHGAQDAINLRITLKIFEKSVFLTNKGNQCSLGRRVKTAGLSMPK